MSSPLKVFVSVLSITLLTGGVDSLTLLMAGFYFIHSVNFCYDAKYRSSFTTRYDLDSAKPLERLWAALLCGVCVFGYAWAIDYSQLVLAWAEPMPFWTEPFLLSILAGLYLLGLFFDAKCKGKASYALLVWLRAKVGSPWRREKGRCRWVYAAHFLLWGLGWFVFALLIGGGERFLSLLAEDKLQLSLFVLSFFLPFTLCRTWISEGDAPPDENTG